MKKLLRLVLLGLALACAAPFTLAADAPPAAREKPPAAKTHWITVKSGVRHNSKCRYFEKSKGRPCTKDEGRACKLCGG